MRTKECSKCHETKPSNLFSMHPSTKDGLQSACKSCKNLYSKQCKSTHKAEIAECNRLYKVTHRPELAAKSRRWRAANPAANAASHQRWYNEHPGAKQAQRALKHAIQAGRILKPLSCEICGSPSEILQGHHHLGYDHPLTVQWVCPPCHGTTFSSYVERERRAA
jgi:hypothetical protein